MSTAQKLIAATSSTYGTGTVEPIGLDFDGAADYLSKSSDLTGNADGKTFTLSMWLYSYLSSTAGTIIKANASGGFTRFTVGWSSSDTVTVNGVNTSGNTVLNLIIPASGIVSARETFVHILVSVNLANSSNRYVYVNDEAVTSTFSTYTDDNIDFTLDSWAIGANPGGGSYFKGRMAGIYLDDTYRDLSTTSNRRLFIDADGLYVKPPTSGIMNITMDDVDDPGANSGTGGDFTLNGTVAQSGRGPNQYNAAASEFDGSSDDLTVSSLTGAADSKLFTFSCNFKRRNTGNRHIFHLVNSGTTAFVVQVEDSGLLIIGSNASNSAILFYSGGTDLEQGKYYSLQISCDMSDTSKRHVLLDGVDAGGNFSVYTDDSINFTVSDYTIGGYTSGTQFKGEISDFYFQDGEYIDLSASNPFFDTDTNKPKNLGADGSEPTGTSPLIYLPIRGHDAGNNKGTGGNFTVNDGPFTGAKGPSEFWGECVEFNGSNQNMASSSNLGFDTTRQYTVALSVYMDAYVSRTGFAFFGGASPSTFYGGIQWEESGGDTAFTVYAADGAAIINGGPDSGYPVGANAWYNVLISCDLSSTSKRWYYVNDSVPSSLKWRTYNTSGSSNLALMNNCKIGSRTNSSQYFDGRIGFLYVHQTYFDFSAEANRRKFFDAYGYPVDLGEDGSKPTGYQPHVYMNKGFHLGTNLGAGGNFTPSNTPTHGGYVKGSSSY
tara:strand:- start:617 stop:2767 length:2151 start_codon:yes stop_codon:yes gene_type:complete